MEKLKFLSYEDQKEIILIKNKIISSLKIPPQSLVLGGSYSRGEATNSIGSTTLSDIEIIVFTYRKLWIQGKLNKISNEFKGDIDLTASFPLLLKLRKTMLNYDLKNSGIILYGPKKYISKRVKYNAGQIPIWEGIREIFFRFLLINSKEKNKTKKKYNICKMYIALANTLLLIKGLYSDSYADKLRNFNNSKEGIISLINKNIFRKIISSLEFKLNKIDFLDYVKIIKKVEVESDVIIVLTNVFHNYFHNKDSLEMNLIKLDKQFPKHLFLNVFYFSSFFNKSFKTIHKKDIVDLSPKLNLILNFKPSKFIHSVFLKSQNKKEEAITILSNYFNDAEACYNCLYDLAWTYPYMEIKGDSQILDKK